MNASSLLTYIALGLPNEFVVRIRLDKDEKIHSLRNRVLLTRNRESQKRLRGWAQAAAQTNIKVDMRNSLFTITDRWVQEHQIDQEAPTRARQAWLREHSRDLEGSILQRSCFIQD